MIGVAWEEGRVKLDLFEGPLDLLLYLIRKNEIDIHDIPIVEVTQQYQALLDHAREHGLLDLDFAGDYFLLAATLIQIKARMLLPRPPVGADGAAPEDPRRELVQQLLEYERFREAAMMLQERAEVAATMLTRPEGMPGLEGTEAALDVDLLALARAFRKVIEDKRLRTPHVYAPSRYTVRDRIRHVLAMLEHGGGGVETGGGGLEGAGRITFAALFEEGTIEEAVVTFLALLELVKRGFVRCLQRQLGGEIELRLVPEGERPDVDAFGESEFDSPPVTDEGDPGDGPSAEASEVAEIDPGSEPDGMGEDGADDEEE